MDLQDTQSTCRSERSFSPRSVKVNCICRAAVGTCSSWRGNRHKGMSKFSSVSRNNAADYIRQGSLRLDNSSDVFLYRRVNRTPRPKPQESSGDGGGSTMHTSSSGRSHGGHSGSF